MSPEERQEIEKEIQDYINYSMGKREWPHHREQARKRASELRKKLNDE